MLENKATIVNSQGQTRRVPPIELAPLIEPVPASQKPKEPR